MRLSFRGFESKRTVAFDCFLLFSWIELIMCLQFLEAVVDYTVFAGRNELAKCF